jgi:hypothetical protein
VCSSEPGDLFFFYTLLEPSRASRLEQTVVVGKIRTSLLSLDRLPPYPYPCFLSLYLMA